MERHFHCIHASAKPAHGLYVIVDDSGTVAHCHTLMSMPATADLQYPCLRRNRVVVAHLSASSRWKVLGSSGQCSVTRCASRSSSSSSTYSTTPSSAGLGRTSYASTLVPKPFQMWAAAVPIAPAQRREFSRPEGHEFGKSL